MAALREIAARFGVEFDTSGVKAGEGALSGLINNLSGLAGPLGVTLSAVGIYKFVEGAAEAATANLRLSETLGVSYVQLKEWQFAAGMSGVEADTLTKSLTRLSGGKFNTKALAQLGVSAQDATGHMKDAPTLFGDVADKLNGITDTTKRNTIATGIFGKQYATLMPLIRQGTGGIAALAKEYHELGGGFSDDFAKKSEEFELSQKKLTFIWKTLGTSLAQKLLPYLLDLSKMAVKVARVLMPLIANSGLMQVVMSSLALKGVMMLSKKVGGLSGGLKLLARNFFTVVLPVLLLEDAFGFLQGKTSLLGNVLDKTFGKGTSEKIRAWFGDYKAHADLANDSNAGFLANLVGIAFQIKDTFVSGAQSADDFYRVVDGVWRGIVLGAKVAWQLVKAGWLGVGAAIQDAITPQTYIDIKNEDARKEVEAWKQQERDRVKALRTGGAPNPFKGTAQETFDTPEQRAKDEEALAKLGAERYEKNRYHSAKEEKNAYLQQGDTEITDEYDRLRDQLDPSKHTPDAKAADAWFAANPGLAGPPPPANVTVNVTVPPGTPQAVADATAKATAKAVQKIPDAKATQAATKPGGK